MKKILMTFCCLLNIFIANGQTETRSKREIRACYGFISDMEIIAAFTNTYTKIISGISGEPTGSDYHCTGPFIAGYNFFVTKRITLGPELNIMQLNIINRYSSGDEITDYFSIANISGRFDFRYYAGETIQLYSGISIGGTGIFYHSSYPEKEKKVAPFLSYQINLFGMQVGKSWAGNIEFGFGRNGLMNIGVSRYF